MIYNIFAIALTVVALSQESHQIGKCPDIDGPTPTYYVDPTNCTRFYECNNGYPFLILCPEHTVFDSKVNVCVHSADGKCIPEVTVSRQARSLPDELTTTSRLATTCPRNDNSWTTFLRDKHNCTRYYICSNGKAILKHCPSGLHFNARLIACDYPYRAGCRARDSYEIAEAQPYMALESLLLNGGPHLAKKCPKEDDDWPTFLIDPKDCRRYYECSHGTAFPQRCPSGLVFNTETLTCDRRENVDCNRTAQ